MSLDRQYATSRSRDRIEKALVAAGMDLNDLQPCRSRTPRGLPHHGPNRDQSTRRACRDRAQRRGARRRERLGGTARYLADKFGCRVTAVDLTEEYCDTSRWLNQLVGLDAYISVQHGDVTDLPFDSASFTVVFSQHVQMNVADKARLYDEARRVLRPRGRLAIWDIIAGTPGELEFPFPWADRPELATWSPPITCGRRSNLPASRSPTGVT